MRRAPLGMSVAFTAAFNLVAASVAAITTTTVALPDGLLNSNHIFNAIHSSMRQWGSSLDHNGVSFFLASAPEGTQFYHGNPHPDVVNGTEWVAFEPEHAMMFARAPGVPMPPRHPPKESPQQLLEEGPGSEQHGYLHTYAARRRLNLLYIDGTSAGKTMIGTLDSQDRILLEDSLNGDVMFREYARAQAMCNISANQWDHKIDGFVRMEFGFEIIMCSFKDTLRLLRATQVAGGHLPPGQPKRPGSVLSKQELTTNNLFKACTSRYDGIGGQRLTVYYDAFVTAFSHLTQLYVQLEGMPRILPRLTQYSQSQLQPIRDEIDQLVLNHDPTKGVTDWQSITDMIVQRYSNFFALVESGRFQILSDLHAEVDDLLSPFVDLSSRNVNLEIERCGSQFMPFALDNDTMPYRAVRAVSHRICAALITVSISTSLASAIEVLLDLKSHLGWSSWKKCHGCLEDEYCRIPIWPSGTLQDFEHPSCAKFQDNFIAGDYWGNFGRPRNGQI